MHSPIEAPLSTPALTGWRVPATIIGGTLLLALSAQIQIPFWPVPMTMHVCAVFLLAGLAGGRLAAAMVVAYMAEAAIGLPVLAGGSAGVAPLIGPTGGYLVGFVVAAFLAGEWIRRRPGGLIATAVPMVAGLAVVYGLGCLWLAQFIGWPAVISAGVAPFVIGDILKVLLAAAATVALRRIRRSA
ncbi:biotin transporter BioY [Inquilinus sp.]|jgi:biotin transport system substrate-specific component|uniref:biotin transporter BioY n=1 Tax=Inquilinus sp. TaxID=1932117 RepID=UPI0037841483